MEVESTLSSYRIFNAVAEAGNLSKAAKELFISQPAISKAVSKLEQSLSVKLFTRNSRGVKLTEEGALLYEYTCSAFESLRRGEESIRKIHTLGMGHIKIGVSTTLCKYLLLSRISNSASSAILPLRHWRSWKKASWISGWSGSLRSPAVLIFSHWNTFRTPLLPLPPIFRHLTSGSRGWQRTSKHFWDMQTLWCWTRPTFPGCT